jgi:Transposase DDE domain group 1
VLGAKLRRSNIDASAGATEELARIVGRIRAHWPKVRVLLRADSGFCREPIMAWCEANRVDYVFGLARNARLAAEIEPEMPGPRRR